MLICHLEYGVDILTIEVDEWYDDNGKLNLTISWDQDDPVESKFNNWTETDFLNAIRDACEQQKELSMGDEVRADGYSVMHITSEGERHLS